MEMNPSIKLYFSFLVITITEAFVLPPSGPETFLSIPPDDFPDDRHPGSSLFFDAVDNGRYVDHTGLIQEVFRVTNWWDPLLIAAPPGFGKTINLDMVHNFFRIPFSSNGTILPAEKSAAYSRFMKHSLNITKSPYFIHFASRPVLYLNFKHFGNFTNLKRLYTKFKPIFQEAVNLFPFIRTNPDYEEFRSECFPSNARSQELNYEGCITRLCVKLKHHFHKSVLVLIDEATSVYQTLINSANCFSTEVVEECVNFLGSSLCQWAKGNPFVWRSFLTGVIRYGERNSCHANNLKYESIFGGRNFLPFYGFSQQEVDSLYKKRKLKLQKDTSMSWIKRNLKGYRGVSTPAGEAFYCPGDIVFLLYKQQLTDEPKVAYYKNSSALQPFSNTLALNMLGTELFSLSERGFGTSLFEGIGMMDFRYLHATIEERGLSLSSFYEYLLDHGFLTILPEVRGIRRIAISNEVMRETLEDALMQVHYFKELYGIPDWMIQAYQDSVINLDNTQESVEKLTRTLAELFWTQLDAGLDVIALREVRFHASVYCYIRQLTSEFSVLRGELPYDNESVTGKAKAGIKKHGKKGPKLDIVAFRKDDRVAIIFEIKHDPHLKKEKSALGALEQIKEKNCVEILNLTEYSPVNKYILVGVHLDESKCECSVVYNTEDLDKRKTASVNRPSQMDHHKQ